MRTCGRVLRGLGQKGMKGKGEAVIPFDRSWQEGRIRYRMSSLRRHHKINCSYTTIAIMLQLESISHTIVAFSDILQRETVYSSPLANILAIHSAIV